MNKTIGNPISFIAGALRGGTHYLSDGVKDLQSTEEVPIEIRDLHIADLTYALRKGFDDFLSMRTDVMFVALIYPVIGLLLTWFAVNQELLPMLFPLVSGFALLGPFFAVGLYELSRRKEAGLDSGWSYAFDVVKSPSLISIIVLGGYLFAVFVIWMLMAYWIYGLTLGPKPPISASIFLTDVFTTTAGWMMLGSGLLIGFVFAAMMLAISVVSFPMLLDRHVGVPKAVITSVRVTLRNPVIISLWGATVVGLLGFGIITLFVGLIVVLPILGHATWHLYRQAVVQPEPLDPR